MLLKDKIAVITGAGRGIGEAIAVEMAKEGALLLLIDINQGDLESVCGELNRNGDTRAFPYICDVSDVGAIEHTVSDIIAKHGRIDILVNNAGIASSTPIEGIMEDEWDLVMDINLKGMAFFSKLVFTEMKKAGFGRIVSMASLAGERGGRFTGVAYSASKAGIIVLTKCLALSGGEYNITANAIAPGLIESDMARALNLDPAGVPLGRMGTIYDVANAVVFLVSEKASYITGTTIDVNGGILMR